MTGDALPLTYTEADIATTRADVDGIKRDLRAVLFTTVGTLLSVLGFVIWNGSHGIHP